MALFGAYAVFDGFVVFLIAAKAGRRRLWLTLGAVVNVVAGLVALTQPRIFALLLVRVLGGWLILRGLTEAINGPSAASEPREKRRWGVRLNAAMSVLFGVGLIAAPKVGALSLMWAVGVWGVLHGLLMLPFALRLRRQGNGEARGGREGGALKASEPEL